MKILILQNPKSASPFESFFRSISEDCSILILTSNNSTRNFDKKDDNFRISYGPEYDSEDFDTFFYEQAIKFKPDLIFSNSESDTLRTAIARDLLGISGQHVSEAIMFRDKIAMKKLFSNMLIPVPKYSKICCASDIKTFARDHDKIVLKPRMGSGSQGVYIIENTDEVDRILTANSRLVTDIANNRYMAEEFIKGSVYHIDVVIQNNKRILFSPSKYFNPPYTYYKFSSGSHMLHAESDDYKLIDKIFLDGIPKAHLSDGIYHFELFKSMENGMFVAGEVGSRIGGGLIKDSLISSFDVNPIELLINVEMGKKIDVITRKRMSGWLLNTTMKNDWRIYKDQEQYFNILSFKEVDNSNQAPSSVTCGQKMHFTYNNEELFFKGINKYLC